MLKLLIKIIYKLSILLNLIIMSKHFIYILNKEQIYFIK
jgi:hypothetical protein